jgi:hypothetical protein
MYYVEQTAAGGRRDPHYGAIEPLLREGKVDLLLYGHVHNAFASKGPIYNSTVVTPASPGAYAAPIHACIGNAGQGFTPINATHPPEWVEWQTEKYGYSEITISNATHLRMGFYDDDTNSLQHEFTIVRNWPRGY